MQAMPGKKEYFYWPLLPHKSRQSKCRLGKKVCLFNLVMFLDLFAAYPGMAELKPVNSLHGQIIAPPPPPPPPFYYNGWL